jgi:Na+-transporting methylmalonyl-CoA/oxaloacetate decarboxylase gamma subunit
MFGIGFVSLVFAIVVLLMTLIGKVVPEPELLVVDAPLPGEHEAGAVEADAALEVRA